MSIRSSPLATRAVYTFIGFPRSPPRRLYLHHDGYPTGAAWQFVVGLLESCKAFSFLASFLSTQHQAGAVANHLSVR